MGVVLVYGIVISWQVQSNRKCYASRRISPNSRVKRLRRSGCLIGVQCSPPPPLFAKRAAEAAYIDAPYGMTEGDRGSQMASLSNKTIIIGVLKIDRL